MQWNNASIRGWKSCSSFADTAGAAGTSTIGLQCALASGSREGDLVLGLASQLFPGLALVLGLARARALRRGGGAVDVHI